MSRAERTLPGLTKPRLGAVICAVLGLIGACTSGSATGTSSSAGSAGGSGLPEQWTDEQVSFDVDGTTVYGTFRHPVDVGTKVPAALLIAGSGPTDRDGNSAAAPGKLGTLSNLATALAGDGVASLRYDKLGTGQTGLGAVAGHPEKIGLGVFTDEASAALAFLAGRQGIDPDRLTVLGHSEGALFALLLATNADTAKSVHSIGLLEPLSKRYLDLLAQQVAGQLQQQQKAGAITADQARQVATALTGAIAELRNAGTVPPDLPGGLANLFAPSSLTFLREADRIDPVTLAATLPPTMPVLISCSDADIQVACADVEPLAAKVTEADLVRLTGVSHVLKEDDSKNPANYGSDLPFSRQLTEALRGWITR